MGQFRSHRFLHQSHETSLLDVLVRAAPSDKDALRWQHKAQIATLLVCSFFSFMAGIGATPLNVTVEAGVAETVREMTVSPLQIVPHLNGEAVPATPPLYHWLACGVSELIGVVSVVTVRLPSALLAAGLALMVYRSASLLYGLSTGFVAGMILVSTYCFFFAARLGTPEILAAFSVFLGLMAMWGFLPKPRFLLGAAVAATLLAGGLPTWLVLLVFMACWIGSGGDQPGLAPRSVAIAGLIGTGVGFLWYAAVFLSMGLESREFLTELTRQSVRVWSEGRPLGNWLIRIGLDMAPWIYLMPVLIAGYIHFRRKLPFPPRIRALVVGIVLCFLTLCAFPGRETHDLLPFYAPLALLAARGLDMANRDRKLHRLLDVAGALLVLWGVAALVILPGSYSVAIGWLLLAVLVAVACGVGILCLSVDVRQKPRIVILAFAVALIVPLYFGEAAPSIEQKGEELAFVGNEIGALVSPQDPIVGVAREGEPLISFASGRTIPFVETWDRLETVLPIARSQTRTRGWWSAPKTRAGRYALVREDQVGPMTGDDVRLVKQWRLMDGEVWHLYRW